MISCFLIRSTLSALTLPRKAMNHVSTTRLLGSKSQAPKFDAEMAEAYSAISENHRHERGPWNIMVERVVSATAGITEPRILDIATGPGEPAKSIAMRLPHAKVIASDVSQDMVRIAKKNTSELSNVECIEADSQDLSMLESNSVDVITCCYGYMFPTDKDAALTETLRVMKPGGTLIATTWDRVDLMKITRDVMKELLGYDPPPPHLNPLSLSDDGLFRDLLHNVGFVDINQTTSTYPFNLGFDRKKQFAIGTITIHEELLELAKNDGEIWKKAESAFWDSIGKYTVMEGDHMVVPDNTFRLTVAKKIELPTQNVPK